MTQTANSAWNSEAAKIGKAVDWILAIAGWPTVYSVVGSGYTLAGDLANFTTIQPWASAPKMTPSETKGRPEEGSQTIGRWSVALLDRQSSVGRHSITDLISRQAYVLGNAGSGHTTTLTADISASTTSPIAVVSTTGFASSGKIYIGQECISYVGVDATHFGTSSVTRGYLLTQATSHKGPPSGALTTLFGNRHNSAPSVGAKVYDFLPNLYRRNAYLYRGFQNITSTTNWLRCAGGVIVGDNKDGASVVITAAGMTWEMYGGVGAGKLIADTITNAQTFDAAYLSSGALAGDFTIAIDAPVYVGNLGNGHYAMKIGSEWMGIASASLVSGTFYNFTVGRGLNGGPPTDNAGNPKADVAWSNVTFTTGAGPDGHEPINLVRDFLQSVNGDGGNGTYDVFETGAGCGIPQGLVNDTSFANIRSAYDWDTNALLYFLFPDATPAKSFIEQEILRPFGLYLFTGNDGKINLARPKHPQKYYIGGTNRTLSVKVAAGGTTFNATMYVGVYTAQQMATEIARALNAVSSNFTASYDTTAHKFSIQHSGSTWDLITSSDNGWVYLGYTAQQLGVAAGANATANSATGAFSGVSLTESDVWELKDLDSRDLQVTSVVYEYDYDWDTDKYTSQREYIDAEAVNLGDQLGAHRLVIKSKGLIGTANLSGTRRGRWTYLTDSGACTPNTRAPATTAGVDADTFAQLVALTYLDRYRFPPLKIKFKTKWSGGLDASSKPVGVRFEVADNFQFSYSPRGVIADREVASDKITTRVFEVISKNENAQGGYVEITALGHRYVSY